MLTLELSVADFKKKLFPLVKKEILSRLEFTNIDKVTASKCEDLISSILNIMFEEDFFTVNIIIK